MVRGHRFEEPEGQKAAVERQRLEFVQSLLCNAIVKGCPKRSHDGTG